MGGIIETPPIGNLGHGGPGIRSVQFGSATQETTGLSWAIIYFLISFFAYMFSLNVVYVKGRRWQDQLATAFSEVGTLSMFLALVATLIATKSDAAPIIAGIATFVWFMDHAYRIYLDWNHQSSLLNQRN